MDKQKLREIRNRHLHEKNAVKSGINYIIEIKPTGLSSSIAIEEQHKDFIRHAYVDIDALLAEVERLQEEIELCIDFEAELIKQRDAAVADFRAAMMHPKPDDFGGCKLCLHNAINGVKCDKDCKTDGHYWQWEWRGASSASEGEHSEGVQDG